MIPIFGEPPRDRANGERHDWSAIGSVLKSRPLEWAVVAVLHSANSASTTARAIRNGGYRALEPHGTFEAVSRKCDGEYRVYARWAGPNQP